ncbi:MAG: hypothetical protein SWH54_02095 [Thermodesulfobacteriota bacterium]|nr:hypothetical protein [Thermodesulfobacteriota bacterium]
MKTNNYPFDHAGCCSEHVFIGVAMIFIAITRLDLFFSGLSPEKKKGFLSANFASRAKRAVKTIFAFTSIAKLGSSAYLKV